MMFATVDIALLAEKEVIMRNFSFPTPWIMILLVSLSLQACGSAQPAVQEPAPSTPTKTPLPSPTFTLTTAPTPTKTPKSTVTPNLAATQAHEDFFAVVQQIHDAGQIASTDGKYASLKDYQKEVASKLSYSWEDSGVSAKNFIVQADFEWSNAGKTINISGCGFVFRQQSNKDHYLILLDAKQGVKLASSTDRGTYSMGSPAKGKEKITDFGTGPFGAKFTLVVNDLKSYVYVNDTYYGEYDLLEFRITEAGPLAGAVLSATEEGYGTRCKITNFRAWILD